MAGDLVVFVKVDTMNFHRFAVDQQLAVADFDGAESDFGRCGLDGFPVGTGEGEHEAVEIGGLGAPGCHVLE